MNKINIISRKPSDKQFSIENIWAVLRAEINKNKLDYQFLELPNQSNSILNIFKNIQYTIKNKKDINLILGDCNYVLFPLFRKKNILIIHDLVSLNKNNKKPIRFLLFWLLWYKIPILLSRRVVAISESTKNEMIKYNLYSKKVSIINNPINPLFLNKSSINKFLNFNQIQVLIVGTKENKNIKRAIKSLEGKNIKLTIIGPLNREIIEMLNEILYENFENISQDLLIKKYLESHILLFVSNYEGFGLPIIEAIMCDVIVVTSDLKPMNTIAPQFTYLTNQDDISAISNTIDEVIENIGEIDANEFVKAKTYVMNKYSSVKYSSEILKLINEI